MRDLKKHKIKRFIVSLIIFYIIAFIILALLNLVFTRTNVKETYTYENYVVNKGDTLWNIAKQYTGSEEDVRQIIYEIKKDNNMTNSYIHEGQTLIIRKSK